MPYGAVAHGNVPKQRADSYPLTVKPPTDTLCVRRRFGRFFVPVRAVEGKTPARAVGLARFCARVYNKKQKTPPNE